MADPMKFCQSHWEDPRIEVANQGMDHLVSKSGEEAVHRHDKDPLLMAHNELLVAAIHSHGVFEGCPVCRLVKPGLTDTQVIELTVADVKYRLGLSPRLGDRK